MMDGRMAGEYPRYSKLDDIQSAAQWAGMLPGVGSAIDLANAGVYAARGKWADAGLTALGAIPLIGDALQGMRGLKKLGQGSSRLM